MRRLLEYFLAAPASQKGRRALSMSDTESDQQKSDENARKEKKRRADGGGDDSSSDGKLDSGPVTFALLGAISTVAWDMLTRAGG